jgi:hypothetical protein
MDILVEVLSSLVADIDTVDEFLAEIEDLLRNSA